MRVSNGNGTRSYVVPFNVVATTWTWVTTTIPGDTAGTWSTGNSPGLHLTICFGAGTTFQAPAANSWQAGNYMSLSTTSTAFWAAVNNSVFITGVMAIPGTQQLTAARSPLLMRPFDGELIKCKRYLQRIGGDAQYDLLFQVSAAAAGASSGPSMVYAVDMRAIPTVSFAGAAWSTGNASAITARPGKSSLNTVITAIGAGTAYSGTNVGSYLLLDARM